MMQGLREPQPADLIVELERVALPLLQERLVSRGAGHCMRVADLDMDLMIRLCARLRAEVPTATVVVLTDGKLPIPSDLSVSSTKLVELRNPLADGSLRPPLLVFVPNDVRASAEDSFGVATFEEVTLDRLYLRLREQLLADLPASLRGAVQESLSRIAGQERPWPFADALGVARFLLTGKVNGNDPDALGAAIYEIGLVPDFEWLTHSDKAPARIVRNRDCVERLTWSSRSERGRVRELGLSNRAFSNQLGNFLAEAGTDDPRHWAKRIVLDRTLWPLAFNKWEFEDGGTEPDSIFIGEVQADLPVVDENETREPLSQLIGQKVFPVGTGGLRKFSISFRVAPIPSKVRGLSKFVAQIISKDQGPIGLARGKAAWKTSADRSTISFSSLGKIAWESGWHYVRVVAVTEVGDLIPLLDSTGSAVPWGADPALSSIRPNESDLFYVLPDGVSDIEPTQRAVPHETSAAHALFRAQFSAVLEGRSPSTVTLSQVSWAEKRPKGRLTGVDMLDVRLGTEGAVFVPVSRALKNLEQKILSAPDGPISWRIPVTMGLAEPSTGELVGWPSGAATAAFLKERTNYFDAVRSGSLELVTQGCLPLVLTDSARKYAAAYLALVEELSTRTQTAPKPESLQAFNDLRKILGLDSVWVVMTDHRGRRRDAVLVAPTHPLRALWLVTWAKLATHWVETSQGAPREYVVPARDALLRLLAPTNYPPVLPTETGHVLIAVDSINPFWTVFAPSNEEDPRGLMGDVCAALGLPEPAIGGALIDGKYLASRIKRYLIQHPYVRTLTLNAFNPGRGAVLAETLLELQKDESVADLRYDIRLFVPDPDASGVGEELVALLSAEGSANGREADAFSTPAESHLYPKLRVAIRATSDFRVSPQSHGAHLSLLFDVFPAEEVGARPVDASQTTAFVHGLVQQFTTEYQEDELTVAWRRLPRHGKAQAFPESDGLPDLLTSLSTALSSATATVSTGQRGRNVRPVITLALGPDDRALLHQVHEVSDWVFTLDRNLGIEFFDHGHQVARPDYLIDHSPDMVNALGHRLVISSRSVAELEALLRPVLAQYGLSAQGNHAVVLLDQLRSLSGRLALKLISSPTQRAEALGLALSRLYLEHQGVFANQIVIPLDAHLELYRVLKLHSDELGDEVSFKRTDLALFDLDVSKRAITCRLVEVKCYTGVGDLTAYTALRSSIAEQIAQSEQVLAYHFDPRRTMPDRPDRSFKTREFATWLEFYLERSERYQVITSEAAEEARVFLRTLDDGYRLGFTRSALVFDFAKPGTEPPDHESGIEFHRVGVDLIRQLVEAAAPSTESSGSTSPEEPRGTPPPEGEMEVRRRRERAPSVPTLATAAFLSSTRDRSVPSESLIENSTSSNFARVGEGILQAKAEGPQLSLNARGSSGNSSPIGQEQGQQRRTDGVADKSEMASSADVGLIEPSVIGYDVMLGVPGETPQYGVLGDVAGRRVAIDLNQTHTISLFGVQGSGKSYTLGMIAEMASLAIPLINVLPQPLATVIFHYSPAMDYRPEFTSMVAPNADAAQIRMLHETFGAQPHALEDVVLLVPVDKLQERKTEYPGIQVQPLQFAAGELQTSHWRFLMGAVGNQATYIRQINRLIKSLRNDLTLDTLREGIEKSSLPDHLKAMANTRLELAGEYIDDTARLADLIRPGRLVIVDLRDEFIEKDEALGLFVVVLQLVADATHNGRAFNKLVVFDEAHKYIESPDLVAGLVEVVREMRHKGTSIMVASQDPPSVPIALIELSTQVIAHRFNSPAWLKHIQRANAALNGLTPEKMANLRPGEAFVWSDKGTDEAFTKGAVKVRLRPRVTHHGGATKTAVE